MLTNTNPPLHLTYGLSIHPGETWQEQLDAIQIHALRVKALVAPDQSFGLGLRLGYAAAQELSTLSYLEPFREFLQTHGLYVFTINGFPYGSFHDVRIKEQVYAPDWRTDDRTNYTCLLAELLARLMPEGQHGSVSTVPVSYKAWMQTQDDWDLASGQLMDTIQFLSQMETETGRLVYVGLEPEPGCFLESAEETIRCFKRLLSGAKKHGLSEERIRRYLGVCLDACHSLVLFEDPLEALDRYTAEGLRIAKVQLSSALSAENTPETRLALSAFNEPVYLHQTAFRKADGRELQRWPDLGPALSDLEKMGEGTVRVHFHVPLFWEGSGPLASTSTQLTPAWFARLKDGLTEHLEIETYSFHALPDPLRALTLDESIAQEFTWALYKLRFPACLQTHLTTQSRP